MHPTSRVPRERRDKRGRRIGHNWWREYICDILSCAEAAWESRRESGLCIMTDKVPGADHDTAYYQLSEREYRMIHPRPTLKHLLVEHAGMRERMEQEAS